MNYLTSMTTTDTEKFLINKNYTTLLHNGVVMGERINGKMHIYLGGKKSYNGNLKLLQEALTTKKVLVG